MKLVFTFPGQSSREPQMVGRAFAMAPAVAADVFGHASEVLHRDLRAHYMDDNPSQFASNRDIQLGVFLVNHVHMCALETAGVTADLSLGLSLGEYNHVVHIGALDFPDAVRLVDERGRLYSEGPEGAMVAIFPVEFDELAPLIEEASAVGPIGVAVAGSPTQTVVAGCREALDHLTQRVDDELFAECVFIEDRVPMHVALFAPVADVLSPVLGSVPWKEATKPYLPNVVGEFVVQNGPSTYVEPLVQHVCESVRWRQSIDFLMARFDDLAFVEVGPKTALTNLLSPKWHAVRRFHTDHHSDPDGFANLVSELIGGSC